MEAWGATPDAGVHFSNRERELYGQLFAQADLDGTGSVGGLRAVEFLSRSGLGQQTLKDIWNLADHGKRAYLDLQGFSVALRLLSHAQAGRSVSQDLIFQEPPGPPQFDGAPPLPPTNTFQSASGCASSRGRSPGSAGEVPTPRQLRKFGRLFCRKCGMRSTLPAEEAVELFQASGLDGSQLKVAWDFADVDRDGQLSWGEFVAAMHLIGRARAGHSLPSPGEPLPGDLLTLLRSLEPAQFYASQPSRSPRSLSPATSAAFDSSVSRSPSRGQLEEPGVPEAWGSFSGGGATSSKDPGWGSAAPDSFGSFGEAMPQPDAQERKSKKEKKERGRKHGRDHVEPPADVFSHGFDSSGLRPPEPQQPPRLAEDLGDGSADWGLPFGGPSSPLAEKKQTSLPGFGSLPSVLSTGMTGQPVEHLEALIEAEKRLVKRLRQDTEELNLELVRLEQACRHEEKETARENEEVERVNSERRHLQQQLEASQKQLVELRHEHEGLHTESIFLRRDQSHFSKEAAFLQRLLGEYARESQVLQQSIEALEHANRSIEAHTRSLEQAQRETEGQARLEQAQLQKQQQETRAVMQALEALRKNSAGSQAAAFGSNDLGGPSVGLGRLDDVLGASDGGFSGLGAEAGLTSQAKGQRPHWSSGLALLDPVPRPRAHGRDREGV